MRYIDGNKIRSGCIYIYTVCIILIYKVSVKLKTAIVLSICVVRFSNRHIRNGFANVLVPIVLVYDIRSPKNK